MSYREERYQSWLENADACNKDFEDFVNKGFLIRIQDGEAWKRRHLEKSDHNLDFAALITEIHGSTIKERFQRKTFYDWVTVAYYYAIYHAALALVSTAGFKSKTHLATLCATIKYYYHEDRKLERKHLDTLGRIEKPT